jgi:hypothetical protein
MLSASRSSKVWVSASIYVERLSGLAFAAPRIVEAICTGRQPSDLNSQTLLNRIDLPLEWSAQMDALGIELESQRKDLRAAIAERNPLQP